MSRRRSWWGWGWEDEALDDAQSNALAASVGPLLGVGTLGVRPAPRLADLDLRPPRISPPAALAGCTTADAAERARHSYGRSYRDVLRLSRAEIPEPIDLVAHPRDEAEVVALLDWCSDAGVAAIPYGGGSSVVGGIEPPREGEDRAQASVSIDLTALDRVLEIDRTSRAARIQAGALGPVLEDQLRSEGLTLRHFPQSFEFSTLGGWIATRAGGHFATLATHIDDLVEALRVVTPAGTLETRRLPGSGAGPSPDRLFLGSEGAFGIITEAWMRLQERPIHKASAGVRFADHAAAVDATRALAQSGLHPTNCRLLDPLEGAISAGLDGSASLLLLGFESADHPVDAPMARALELCRDHGGEAPGGVTTTGPGADPGRGAPAGREGDVGAWRNAFLRAPYQRDALVRMSVIVETFETACTWDAYPGLHAAVTEAVTDALARVCGGGVVTCRFTHVYPDGVAPYFSVFAPGRPGSELSQWDEIKAAASEAILASGGTITHHHAVGRDHGAWYRRQRPALVGSALAAAKATFDPSGICNPGVLVP